MSKKMEYLFEGIITEEKSKVLTDTSGSQIVVESKVPKEVLERVNEIRRWHEESAKTDWVLGEPSHKYYF